MKSTGTVPMALQMWTLSISKHTKTVMLPRNIRDPLVYMNGWHDKNVREIEGSCKILLNISKNR
jgi:hypothetical protein